MASRERGRNPMHIDLSKLSRLAPGGNHSDTAAVVGALTLGAVAFGLSIAQEMGKQETEKTPVNPHRRGNPYRAQTVGELEDIQELPLIRGSKNERDF